MIKKLFKRITATACACTLVFALASDMAGKNAPVAAAGKSAPDAYHDDWLHVNENAEVVDMNGNPVWMTGVN